MEIGATRALCSLELGLPPASAGVTFWLQALCGGGATGALCTAEPGVPRLRGGLRLALAQSAAAAGPLGPSLPLVLDQPLGVVKEPLFPLPAGSDSRPAGMRVESRIGGPALGGSPFHMGPSSSRTGDSRTLPAVVTYPDVMIAMAVLLARYGASSVYPPFSTIFAVAGSGSAPGVFGISGSRRPGLPGPKAGPTEPGLSRVHLEPRPLVLGSGAQNPVMVRQAHHQRILKDFDEAGPTGSSG